MPPPEKDSRPDSEDNQYDKDYINPGNVIFDKTYGQLRAQTVGICRSDNKISFPDSAAFRLQGIPIELQGPTEVFRETVSQL